jgi:AcrR family transcriptional regulator
VQKSCVSSALTQQIAQAGFAFERTFINLRIMARTTGSHSDITGPRVRAAALRLFAQGGYAPVSMRAIAADVGVQAGALYNYTPDKQTLLFELMRGHMTDLLAKMPVANGASPCDQLEGFVSFHIRFHADRPDAVFIAYMELRNLTPDNFTSIEALRREYEDHLQGILTAGVTSGDFAVTDTKIVTLAIIAMLTGVNTWFRAEGRLSLDQVVTQYWDMVRRAVGTP